MTHAIHGCIIIIVGAAAAAGFVLLLFLLLLSYCYLPLVRHKTFKLTMATRRFLLVLLKSCMQRIDDLYFPSRKSVWILQIGEISTNAHHLISMDIFTSRANYVFFFTLYLSFVKTKQKNKTNKKILKHQQPRLLMPFCTFRLLSSTNFSLYNVIVSTISFFFFVNILYYLLWFENYIRLYLSCTCSGFNLSSVLLFI